ncbi:PAS domain-containing sensor histidine kinase [Neorhizobium lilium]|uniref:histidine kinase n=1 Tax=Neorhizobium lilium TaxID=2503024 RepID=A0A3S4UVL0_9HYPH|nr:ATP-binding protein [Neorhizobium lilium]RWX81763.1 PAS domain-containing sensor histidine kinase [Neorhizobium lilium]
MDLRLDMEPTDRPKVRDEASAIPGEARYVAACVLLGLAIFVIDSFTLLGSAVAVLYVLVIVMASQLGGSLVIKKVSFVCAIATMVAFALVHGAHPETQALLRLIFSLAANGVTTAILLRREVEIENRRAAEASLNASEHRYKIIFDTLAVAIWEHDFTDVKRELQTLRQQGIRDLRQYIADHPEFVVKLRKLARITNVNQTALKLMGVASKKEFFANLDMFLWEMDQSFAKCLIALDEGRLSFQSETKLRNRHGRLIPVIVALNFPADGQGLERIQGSIVDITERLAFQEAIEASRRELEHASRAAMIGEISASIAHEVNQPLSATMNYLQAALRWMDREEPDLDETKKAIQRALVSTEHSADVVKRVRMLLGKAKSDTAEIDIETAILDAVRLKRADLSSHGTKLSLDLSRRIPLIQGDRILLQQAFLNIITNAMQAMDAVEPEGRTLSIESIPGASDIVIRISDSGPGLGDNSGESLFRAFNTTKENGMGLGLAMCRSIVAAHGGAISIANRSDARGAVVEISLPGIAAADQSAAGGD